MDNKDILLDVKDLRTHFVTKAGTVRAVDGVSFSLAKGDSLGIVGESGSGKTITALSIMRLIPGPAGRIIGGSIRFHGKDLLKIPEAAMRRIRGNDISMIFQDPMTSLNPIMTVGHQIAEAVRLHQRVPNKSAHKTAVDMLELVGIPDASRRVSNYPFEFSGGMRQRAMIAMALSCSPQLLIADEPTTALDVTIQAQILELMQKLQEETGSTIIMITHDLGVVAELCKKVLVMYAGCPVEKAGVEDLFANPKHPYTWGLLGSIPSIEGTKQRLVPIEGAPPDLRSLPEGCRFYQRCKYRKEICKLRKPEEKEAAVGHSVCCHLYSE